METQDQRPDFVELARRDAASRSPETILGYVKTALLPWSRHISFMRWTGGMKSTHQHTAETPGEGLPFTLSWKEYAEVRDDYARTMVVEKGEGICVSYTTSKTGGSTDGECEQITGLLLDADGVGSWDTILQGFRSAGLAFIAQTSTSSTADRQKFHVIVPLAEPLIVGPDHGKFKATYRRQAQWVLAMLARAAGVQEFDPKICNRLQTLEFLPCPFLDELGHATPVPEIEATDGQALGWSEFLKASGFEMRDHAGGQARVAQQWYNTRRQEARDIYGFTPEQKRRRASNYLRKLPPAISGQHGHDAAWEATLYAVSGFDLDPDVALELLATEYNSRCQPPWSMKDLKHKVDDAMSKSRAERGWKLKSRGR